MLEKSKCVFENSGKITRIPGKCKKFRENFNLKNEKCCQVGSENDFSLYIKSTFRPHWQIYIYIYIYIYTHTHMYVYNIKI